VIHFRPCASLQHALELLQRDMRRIAEPHAELGPFHPPPRHRQIAVLEFPIGVNGFFESDMLGIFRVLHSVLRDALFSRLRRRLLLFVFLFLSMFLFLWWGDFDDCWKSLGRVFALTSK